MRYYVKIKDEYEREIEIEVSSEIFDVFEYEHKQIERYIILHGNAT